MLSRSSILNVDPRARGLAKDARPDLGTNVVHVLWLLKLLKRPATTKTKSFQDMLYENDVITRLTQQEQDDDSEKQ
jgi:hypothetical protein